MWKSRHVTAWMKEYTELCREKAFVKLSWSRLLFPRLAAQKWHGLVYKLRLEERKESKGTATTHIAYYVLYKNKYKGSNRIVLYKRETLK